MDEIYKPGDLERRLFGLLAAAFFGLIGWVLRWRGLPEDWARAAWIAGASFAALYYTVPSLRFPLFAAWMRIFRPIGRLMNFLIFALIYYLVLTPIGVTLRLLGRELLSEGFESETKSYWTKRRRQTGSQSAFSQYE